jgi:DNA helicase-2/ATP-dependent DNA helicase PcrA
MFVAGKRTPQVPPLRAPLFAVSSLFTMCTGLLTSWRGLNEEQTKAVTWTGGKTLVNACAGSGKTATAAAKVAGWMEAGVAAESILLLTFTRKAAGEMRRRVSGRIGVQDCGITSGTYHSVALRLMRSGVDFGLGGSFSVLDDDGVERLWKKSLKKCGGDPREARRAASAHSLAVNLLKDPEQAVGDVLFSPAPGAAESFASMKRESKVLDFDDILATWSEALKKGGGGRGKWTHVMVDEFQDNSEVQYEILKHLGAKEMFVVGDPNQCIYSFRGSAPKLMTRFSTDNPDAASYSLSLNYRSGQEILDEANYSLLESEKPAALIAAGGRSAKAAVHKYCFGDQRMEADFTTRGIAWRMKAGTKPGQIAILFRSAYQSTQVEMALRRSRIPYRKYGGGALTDAADVKDYLAFLRVWLNPADRVSMSRAALLFPGVGDKAVEKAVESGEARWPAKAEAAGLWIAKAQQVGWPDGARWVAEKMAGLLEHNYPDDHAERMERILELSEAAGDFTSLADFLDHYSTGEDSKGVHPDDCITLSTIHSAKGLEWDDVFLCGAGGQQFPSKRAVESGCESEERRLFYVAVTRARKFLCLTYPESLPHHGWQGATPFAAPEGWRRTA